MSCRARKSQRRRLRARAAWSTPVRWRALGRRCRCVARASACWARARARPAAAHAAASQGAFQRVDAAADARRGRCRTRSGGFFAVDLDAMRSRGREHCRGSTAREVRARWPDALEVHDHRAGRRSRAGATTGLLQHARRAVPAATRATCRRSCRSSTGPTGTRGARSRSSTSTTQRALLAVGHAPDAACELDARGAWELRRSATASQVRLGRSDVRDAPRALHRDSPARWSRSASPRSATSTCATPTASRRLERAAPRCARRAATRMQRHDA